MSQFDTTGAGAPRGDVSGALGDAKHATEDAGGRIKAAGKEAASNVVHKVKAEAEHRREQASGSIKRIAEELERAARVCASEDEWAGKALSTGPATLKQASGYLSGVHVEDLVRDCESFARRNPAAYLSASVATGFLLARIGKTAAVRAREAGDGRQDFTAAGYSGAEAGGYSGESGSFS